MKKMCMWLMLVIVTLICFSSMSLAADKMSALGAKSITGNSASLDAITSTNYKNGAICMVPILNDKIYFYIYDGTENAIESLPNIVIPNDNITGIGAWKLLGAYTTVSDGTKWLTGNGVPQQEDGVENDFYFNEATNDIYVKNQPSIENMMTGGTASGVVNAANAFDNDPVTVTDSTAVPASIIYDLGVGVTLVPREALIKPAAENTLTDFTISGSNNNIDWTVLSTQNEEEGTVFEKSEEFETEVGYRYFKLTCTEASAGFSIAYWKISPVRIDWTLLVNIKGETGAAGATWLFGADIPANELGVVGDNYINTTSYEIYNKTGADVWTSIGNIKGEQGIPGTPGSNGVDGATWLFGADVPANELGVVGDNYLNTTSYEIYNKTGATTWTSIGNIKGDAGETGADGTGFIGGVLSAPCVSVEPANPAPGEFVIWTNAVDLGLDGTIDLGDEGDMMIKVNIGGIINIGKIFDYSTGVWRNPS